MSDEPDNKRACFRSNNNIEQFLGGGYAEQIDLSKIDNSIINNNINNDTPFPKISRQTADQIFEQKENGILYDLLNITDPFFNLRMEYDTISIFFHTYSNMYPEFKPLLVLYVNNAFNEKNMEKAIEIKKIIMQFIADKMNK